MRKTQLLFMLFLVACTHNGSSSGNFNQAEADALVAACGGEVGWLIVEEDGTVIFNAPVVSDYDVSRCILEGVRDAGVSKFGFLGNEKLPASDE